ncbi:MAG TPA: zinc dependent phospholipase C family protein, partial [Clostridia bacterium]|nr:zinc dependent phospholipase C family protein [Clostridia bacterium]
MPGLFTHYLAADAAYNSLQDGPLKEFITKYRHIYDMGAQGPDVFSYYRPLSKYREDITRYNAMLHERQVEYALRTMIKYMSDQIGEDKNILAAYMLGYIVHYAVDSACNPYMHYRAGFVAQGRGDEKKFKYYYNKLRSEIDYLITKKITGKKPTEIRMTPHVEVDYKELDEFCRMYPVVLKVVYGKNSSRDFIIKAYQNMYEFSKKLYKTKFYHRLFYKIIELIKKNKGEFTLLFAPRKIKDLDQLNEKKAEWLL